jgi:hypothetical protein
METVTVSAKALSQLLDALSGPPHHIRELQMTRGPLVGDDNPINILIAEWNQNVEAYNAKQ